MTWKKVTGYELEWQVRIKGGRVTILFGDGESPVTSHVMPAQDFSVMADMLRHELPRVWYEDAQKIFKPVIKNRHQDPTDGQGAYCTAHANRLSTGLTTIRGRGQI